MNTEPQQRNFSERTVSNSGGVQDKSIVSTRCDQPLRSMILIPTSKNPMVFGGVLSKEEDGEALILAHASQTLFYKAWWNQKSISLEIPAISELWHYSESHKTYCQCSTSFLHSHFKRGISSKSFHSNCDCVWNWKTVRCNLMAWRGESATIRLFISYVNLI